MLPSLRLDQSRGTMFQVTEKGTEIEASKCLHEGSAGCSIFDVSHLHKDRVCIHFSSFFIIFLYPVFRVPCQFFHGNIKSVKSDGNEM